MITSVKGTQDYIDLSLFNFALDNTKKHLLKNNFSEINLPHLEKTELFKRTLGLNTDVVNKEMYVFGENNDICLRPEITASIVRTFVEQHIQTTPWKVFTFGSCFRHERPQKGRWREFFQVSAEIIGSSSVAQDAFFIKILNTLFSQVFTLDSYTLHLNYLGVASDREQHKKALISFLDSHDTIICETCRERKTKNLLRIFDCKNESCQKLYQTAPKITDYLCDETQQEWSELKKYLDLLSVTYIETPTLVRGLDYYNKTVFEFASSNLGAQTAFCGGGRYDSLVKEVGGDQDQPAIGAAIGFSRLLLLLEQIKDRLPIAHAEAPIVIIPLEIQQNALALIVAENLLSHGKCVDILLDETSVKSKMRKANKMGAQWAVIIGPQEQSEKTVLLKHMLTGQEKSVSQINLAKEI